MPNHANVGVMRARLMMKLMGIVVFLILTVMSARSCSNSSSKSDLNPVNVQNNAVAGYCANQQITNETSGSSASTEDPLSQLSPQMQTEAHGLGLNFNCPTTTVGGAGG